MSVFSTAATAVATNHALNAQAMQIAAFKMKNEATQSIIQMLEKAVTPVDGTKKVDIRV